LRVGRGTSVAALIVVGDGFHFKPIESAALPADPDLGEVRANLAVESVLIHAKETRRIAQAYETRQDGQRAS
jgi:hypothetical protein